MDGLDEKLSRIKAVVFDIDGVLTDGRMIPLADGDLLRIVDAKDSFAIRAAGRKGLIVGIISGGKTFALEQRCLHVGIRPENIFLGARGKMALFRRFCEQNALAPEEVMYFGDDIPDTQVLRACGVGVVPSDAVEEAKEAADIISSKPGGKGCVRAEVERLMKHKGLWVFDPDKFDEIF